MAVGHPIDKRGKIDEGRLRIFLAQATIAHTGFALLICEAKTGKKRPLEVDLKTLYETYKSEALSYLSIIEANLIDKWGTIDDYA